MKLRFQVLKKKLQKRRTVSYTHLQEKGASLVSLGKRILRTETAAITALSILMYQWGDVGSD